VPPGAKTRTRSRLVAAQAELVSVGSSGAARVAIERGDAEDAHLAGPGERQKRRQGGEDHVDLAAHDVVQGRRVSLVGDVHQLHLRALLEQHASEMQRGPLPEEA